MAIRGDELFGITRDNVGFVPVGQVEFGGDGRIRCHDCGAFYKNVANHAILKHGYLSGDDYRERWGLMQSQPLVGLEQSEFFREHCKRRIASGELSVETLAKRGLDALEARQVRKSLKGFKRRAQDTAKNIEARREVGRKLGRSGAGHKEWLRRMRDPQFRKAFGAKVSAGRKVGDWFCVVCGEKGRPKRSTCSKECHSELMRRKCKLPHDKSTTCKRGHPWRRQTTYYSPTNPSYRRCLICDVIRAKNRK